MNKQLNTELPPITMFQDYAIEKSLADIIGSDSNYENILLLKYNPFNYKIRNLINYIDIDIDSFGDIYSKYIPLQNKLNINNPFFKYEKEHYFEIPIEKCIITTNELLGYRYFLYEIKLEDILKMINISIDNKLLPNIIANMLFILKYINEKEIIIKIEILKFILQSFDIKKNL